MQNLKTFIIALGFVVACQKQQNDLPTTSNPSELASIEINPKQMQTMGIVLGNLEKRTIEEFALTNGIIDVPPESRAVVTAKMEGFIKKCDLLIGAFVQKGQVLAVLETPRLITLQEEYLTTKNQISFLEQEFTRQTRLDESEAGIKKNLQKISTDLQAAKIRLASLEKQLQFIGINPSALQPSQISSAFVVTSPISGYVRSVSVAQGQNVLAETPLFEIVSKEHLHIELQVFEKDIVKIRKGQKVYFQIPNLGEEVFEGEVFLIGQNFDTQNKTVNVHVHFEEKDKPFLPGMYVNARISLGGSEWWVVPEGAITQEDESFIFYTTDQKKFYQMPVKIRKSESEWVAIELSKDLPQNTKIVVQGAIYLQGAIQRNDE